VQSALISARSGTDAKLEQIHFTLGCAGVDKFMDLFHGGKTKETRCGDLSFQGASIDTLTQSKIDVRKLCLHISQHNARYHTDLTVRQVLEFAEKLAPGAVHFSKVRGAMKQTDVGNIDDPKLAMLRHAVNTEQELRHGHDSGVSAAIHHLGLSSIAELPVTELNLAESMVVRIAEALFSGHRIFVVNDMLDVLPTSEQQDFVKVLQRWVQGFKTIVILGASLLATPLFELADKVVVVKDGRVASVGTPKQLHIAATPALEQLSTAWNTPSVLHGWAQNSLPIKMSVDFADKLRAVGDASNASECKTTGQKDDWYTNPRVQQRFGRAMYWQDLRTLGTHISRSFSFVKRSPMWYLPKPLLSLVSKMPQHCACLLPKDNNNSFALVLQLFGLWLGSLYYDPAFSNFTVKASLASYSCVVLSSCAALDAKHVSNFARDMHNYIDWGWTGSRVPSYALLLVTLPISALSAMIFTASMYFLTGFINEASNFLFFLCALLFDLAMGGMVRVLAASTLLGDKVRSISGVFVIIYLLCGGYVVLHSRMSKSMESIYWTNPFAWFMRSVLNNEWESPAYQIPYLSPSGATTFGAYISNYLSIELSQGWKWGGVGFLAGYWLLMVVVLFPLSVYFRRPKRITINTLDVREASSRPIRPIRQEVDAAVAEVTIGTAGSISIKAGMLVTVSTNSRLVVSRLMFDALVGTRTKDADGGLLTLKKGSNNATAFVLRKGTPLVTNLTLHQYLKMQHLHMNATAHTIDDLIADIIATVQLTKYAATSMAELDLHADPMMKFRLLVALALCQQPDLLIVEEPMLEFQTWQIVSNMNMFRRISNAGTAVMLIVTKVGDNMAQVIDESDVNRHVNMPATPAITDSKNIAQVPVLSSSVGHSFGSGFRNVCFKETKDSIFHIKTAVGRIISNLAMSMFMGMVYVGITQSDLQGVSARVSLSFVCCVLAGVMNMSVLSGKLLLRRQLLKDEIANGVYTAPEWYIVFMACEVVWSVVLAALWTFLPPAMANQVIDHELGLQYFATMSCFLAYAALAAFLCFIAPSVEMLGLLQQVMLSATSLVAGLFVPSPILPGGWKWLQRIVPSSYALDALLNAVFYCEGADCPTVPVPRGATYMNIPVYTYLKSRYGLEYDSRWSGIGWMYLITLILVVLGAVALYASVLWSRRRVHFVAWANSTLPDEMGSDAIQRGSSSLNADDVARAMQGGTPKAGVQATMPGQTA
jgi:ABC-type branched-subunit amino acid transport system ATPase component